jgi:hypothetical protein
MANCKKCGRSAGLFRFICTSCERTLANEERLKDTPKFDAQNVYPDSPEAASAEEIINALSPKPEQEAVEPIEKTTAPKARKGCGIIAIVLIFVVVFVGFEDLMVYLLRAFFGLFVCLLTLGTMCS